MDPYKTPEAEPAPQSDPDRITRPEMSVGVVVLASFLNFLLLGLPGYLIIGQYWKAAAVFAATITLSLCGIGLIIPIVATVDVAILGARLVRGESIGKWQFF